MVICLEKPKLMACSPHTEPDSKEGKPPSGQVDSSELLDLRKLDTQLDTHLFME